MPRKLTPEFLDHLPPDDPGAMRSRRDLRRINRFMGNESWILSQIPPTTPRITELGAGDGSLLRQIHTQFPSIPLTGCDLMPRPTGLPEAVEWIQANLFMSPPEHRQGTVVANLFLHHFTDTQMAHLGELMAEFDTIIVNEPLRARLPRLLGKLASPMVHPITRHDMRVSIEAGFRPGELPTTLGLDAGEFTISESSTWCGSLRMLALRC